MEIEILSQSKNAVEFIIKNERHTFPNLLRDKLLSMPNVSFAAYTLEHPLDN
ncbi:MAG: DNA-directed RNA polymerase subunit L, partial [Candidatus Diapherotrites archaeon]|nr:DNA-directed RNA polymerase subunit L [Candidatus Diapherotrites archaeon]